MAYSTIVRPKSRLFLVDGRTLEPTRRYTVTGTVQTSAGERLELTDQNGVVWRWVRPDQVEQLK